MQKSIILSILLNVTLLVAHCTFASSSDATTQKIILDEINAYRLTHHLSPLKLIPIISNVAAEHSKQMATKQIAFGHGGFDQRVHTLFAQIPHATGIAENVAYGNMNGHEAVQLWLHSKGHRENIEGNYTLTGIGMAHDQTGRVYYTQIFMRNRPTD